MHRTTVSAVLTAAALAAGCAGRVGYSAVVSNDGYGYGPDLVYAAPGVQVIADYDEPIFYSDSYYWRNDGGTWYRSSSYSGGWVYAAPPRAVLQIERPRDYVHYRPQGWSPDRGRRQPTPVVRDHRDDRRFVPVQPRREQPRREPPPAAREAPVQQRSAPPARPRPQEQPRENRGHGDDRDRDRDHRK